MLDYVSAPSFSPADLLADAIARGAVHQIAAGEFEVVEPIKVTIDAHMLGAGLVSNGCTLVSSITDGSDVLTIEIEAESSDYIDARYLTLEGITIMGNGQEGNGLVLRSLAAKSLYAWKLDRIVAANCGGNGILIEGHVFEGDMHAVCTQDNGGYGMLIRHAGSGQASAISVFGGTHRKNALGGIGLDNGARDLKLFGTYFCENGGPGIRATQGLTLASGCGFENNAGCGIWFQNYAVVQGGSFSTWGVQQYSIDGVLAGNLGLYFAGNQESYGQPVNDVRVVGSGRVYAVGDMQVNAGPGITVTRAW